MAIQKYIMFQYRLHPSMQCEDVYKLCYQAAFGVEHLLNDKKQAYQYLINEFNQTSSQNIELVEYISKCMVRVNLASLKYNQLDIDNLFNAFVSSYSKMPNSKTLFVKYLDDVSRLIAKNKLKITAKDWKIFQNKMKTLSYPPIHHSDYYHNNESPAYRIINIKFLSLIYLK